MRTVLNISAVLVCGALAGLAGLTQVAPSEAAQSRTVLMPDPASRTVGTDPDVVLVKRGSGGVEAHFATANTTHDGHLTRDQALQADWSRVARHFDEIDSDHRGFVTVEQIHAFNKIHRRHRKDAA